MMGFNISIEIENKFITWIIITGMVILFVYFIWMLL